ncbi:hypothetical protein [Kribbella yunnanensis]
MQSRLRDPEDFAELLDHTMRLREELSAPFWDSLMLACERSSGGLPAEVATAATFHQDPAVSDDDRHVVNSALPAWLRGKVEKAVDDERILAVSSRVLLTDGESAHIPMLDFAARVQNEGSEASILAVCSTLPFDAKVLMSGRSFHYYGKALLSGREHQEFLGRSLLFAPIVDHRWIAHQLMMGYTALRISAGRDGLLPRYIGEHKREA